MLTANDDNGNCADFGENLVNPTKYQRDNNCLENKSKKKEGDGFVYVKKDEKFFCCIGDAKCSYTIKYVFR